LTNNESKFTGMEAHNSGMSGSERKSAQNDFIRLLCHATLLIKELADIRCYK